MRGGGQPLSASSRAFFEPRLGADLSNVRVHTDANATGTAKALNAKAFTVGRDVVFGAGQYEPASNEGRRLLAHELTHVVQQRALPAYSQRAQTLSMSITDLERRHHYSEFGYHAVDANKALLDTDRTPLKYQAKLKIGEPNDIFKQKADRVANMVMRAPEPMIQMKCTVSSDDTKLRTKMGKHAPPSHYGANFNHTFPSNPEGCSLNGIEVTEVVSTVRDDFGIHRPNVPAGKNIWKLTAQNTLDKPDSIWTQAGMKGLGANPVNGWPAVLDQNQLFYYRNPGDKNWQLGPGIIIKVTLSGDLRRQKSLKVTTTDHGISRIERYRGPVIRVK